VFERPRRHALLIGLAWAAAAGAQAPAAGGALTQPVSNRNAFTLPAPGLSALELRAFALGNRVFNTHWVVAPASTDKFDGLGPTFNRNSCSGCHLRDGRGRPPINAETTLESMLLRLSVPGRDRQGGPKPLAAYGDQLNDRAIPGVAAEGRVVITYREQPGTFADGERYSLRVPSYSIADPAHGALPANTQLSARVAPAVFGLGLLEAIAEAAIVAAADPDDRDRNGISGRVNRVHDPLSGQSALGRFGWKANASTLKAQAAMAAHGDIGLTSAAFPNENCPPAQTACARAARGNGLDLDEPLLDKLAFYTQVLAVPAQRPATAQTRRGERQFSSMGCADCHTPTQQTDRAHPIKLLRDQTFQPYTDLLLHDMGPGLADGRPDFAASGREWRTAPLWGLGLLPLTNDHQFLLHDGRARGFSEAILWHGGEAQAAADRFRRANKADRDDLIAFLETR
jgi:CxxC motif-containing protein (DUF1111 family)